MDSSIKDVKEVKGFIAIMTAAVLLFIIIMLKTPYLLELSRVFSMGQDGMRMTSNALDSLANL